MSENINIEGLSKAQVLKALHDGTRAIGMGVLRDLGRDMTLEEAEALTRGDADLYFDYVAGRPLKVHLNGDSFDPRLYDRDAGEGRAEAVISAVRQAVSA